MPVSNSSPLIHLVRLAKVGHVRRLFPRLLIPLSVRREAIDKGKAEGYRDALTLQGLEREGWLRAVKLRTSSSTKLADELMDTVGRGEAEAIALALEEKDRLLMDDQKGRSIAELHGVETTTTLGLLFELLVKGVLPREDYVKNVKNYSSQGWINSEIVQEYMARAESLE